MSEITLKEIPVQILNISPSDVVVLRVPQDWSQEEMSQMETVLQEAFLRAGKEQVTCCIGKHIDLAVVRNIIKAHAK